MHVRITQTLLFFHCATANNMATNMVKKTCLLLACAPPNLFNINLTRTATFVHTPRLVLSLVVKDYMSLLSNKITRFEC